jgi:hypothetical protein
MSRGGDEFGHNLESWAPISLRQAGAMARINASVHPHDSDEFKSWIAASQRYERAARLADENARELHGFPGDDS